MNQPIISIAIDAMGGDRAPNKVIEGCEIYLNNNQILKTKKNIKNLEVFCGEEVMDVIAYDEKLPNGYTYTAVYRKVGSFKNSDKYIVPKNHYFFLGDNRDCSKDSRYLNSVGYVNRLNLVGKARLIFFSTNISLNF